MKSVGRMSCPDLEGNLVVKGIYTFFMKAIERTDGIYAADGGLTVTSKGKEDVMADMEVYLTSLFKADKINHIPTYKVKEVRKGNLVFGLMLAIDPNDIRRAVGLPESKSIFIEPDKNIIH